MGRSLADCALQNRRGTPPKGAWRWPHTLLAQPTSHARHLNLFALQERARGRYHLLEDDGICAVGEAIQNDDIYINKSSPKVTRGPGEAGHVDNQDLPDTAYSHTPQKYKGPVGESCVVDSVMLTTNDDSLPTFKV